MVSIRSLSSFKRIRDLISSSASENSQVEVAPSLREAKPTIIEGEHQGLSHSPDVWLEPASGEMSKQSLLSRRQIHASKFVIGRKGADVSKSPADLLLYEDEPYTISKQHCEIERSDTGAWVRDMGSHFGILVNGERIGRRSSNLTEIHLERGTHALILGRRSSSFEFRLIID